MEAERARLGLAIAMAKAASDMRTLYVSRPLRNGEMLRRWAKGVGIDTIDPTDMHVTIAFSRRPVDWFAMPTGFSGEEVIVPAGGPRLLARLGSQGEALVLKFASAELRWRHDELRDAGASWDWPEYQPHVTLDYAVPAGFDTGIEAYQGALVFGPEKWVAVDDEWEAGE